MSEIADILDRAADLIEPEGAWVRREYAVTRSGYPISVLSDKACRFCGVGAIMRATETGNARLLLRKIAGLPALLGFGSLSSFYDWNDVKSRTQAEVVAALREAAAKARGDTA